LKQDGDERGTGSPDYDEHNTESPIGVGRNRPRGAIPEIEPVFGSAKAQDLKIESICVAGGPATVAPAP